MINSTWYNSLVSPPLTPPAWVFPQAWTFLYITIFLAFLMFLFSKSENKKRGYIYFFIQLILNLSWTPAFFVFNNILCIEFLDCYSFFVVFLSSEQQVEQQNSLFYGRFNKKLTYQKNYNTVILCYLFNSTTDPLLLYHILLNFQ